MSSTYLATRFCLKCMMYIYIYIYIATAMGKGFKGRAWCTRTAELQSLLADEIANEFCKHIGMVRRAFFTWIIGSKECRSHSMMESHIV